jgi:hypothetical protein
LVGQRVSVGRIAWVGQRVRVGLGPGVREGVGEGVIGVTV